jgi:hypothetical protein
MELGIILITITTNIITTIIISRNVKRSKSVMQKYLLANNNLEQEQEKSLIRQLWSENDGEHKW